MLVLLRLGVLVRAIGALVSTLVGIPSVAKAERRRHAASALRRSLERLGLTYLKLGQFLATRHDLLPPEFIEELTRLFERVPTLPFPVVAEVVETAFGETLPVLFAAFETEPLAAASVAQVHRARLADGTTVAVKIQRPGIAAIFEADIAILRRVAALADVAGVLGSLSVRQIIDQFAAYTRREFDFRIEAATAERLRREAPSGCRIPRIVGQLTGRNVLTMEFMEGISLGHLCTLAEAGDTAAIAAALPGFDRRRVLRTLTRAALHQFFVTGFFHGDPHPGNILVRPDNEVVLLDFGIFGALSRPSQELLARYAECLATGRVEDSFRHLSRIYIGGRHSDPRAFRREAVATLRAWYEASRDPAVPMAKRHLGGSFTDMIGVVRRHHYWTAMDYLLFWRAMIVLDAIALRLDPEFDLVGEMRDFFAEIRPSPAQRLVAMLVDGRRRTWSADAHGGPAKPGPAKRGAAAGPDGVSARARSVA